MQDLLASPLVFSIAEQFLLELKSFFYLASAKLTILFNKGLTILNAHQDTNLEISISKWLVAHHGGGHAR